MAAPVSAIGSGRQRALLSEAQAAAASLRALPLDAPASEVTPGPCCTLSPIPYAHRTIFVLHRKARDMLPLGLP